MSSSEESASSAVHQPVMLREVLNALDLKPGMIVVDGTVGAGGHSKAICDQLGETGKLLGLDRDPMMLQFAGQKLKEPQAILQQASYVEMPEILTACGFPQPDRVLLDLGLSSDQLADASRGFGFASEGLLDLRFDTSQGKPAWDWIADQTEESLEEVLKTFGEERYSPAIARELINRQAQNPIKTAKDLVEAIENALPNQAKQSARKHPATRVFQAIRIAVNHELTHVETALTRILPEVLKPGGVAVVITFHSLEDRIVKDAFRDQSRWQNLTPRPQTATPTEQRINPRARPAKLRAARRKPGPRESNSGSPP